MLSGQTPRVASHHLFGNSYMLEVSAAIAVRQGQPFTATELADVLGTRLNLVTAALGRLEAVGLVARQSDVGRSKPYEAEPSIYWQACESLLHEVLGTTADTVLDLTGPEPAIELDTTTKSSTRSPDESKTEKPDTVQLPPSMPPSYRSHIVTDGQLALQAIQLEYRIFTDADFFPHYPSGRIEDYDAFRERSLFHVVTNGDDNVVGMVRSLIGRFDELPIGHYVDTVWDNAPVDPVCEYATLAIAPEERGAGIAEELYRSVFALAWGSKATGLVALVDPWLRDLLNGFYGCNFQDIGPSVPFSYGEVVPIGVAIADLEVHLPVSVPTFWSWLRLAIDSFEVTIDIRDLVVDGRPISRSVSPSGEPS